MAKKELANTIRIARLRKGYSQKILALKSGMSRNAIIMLENPKDTTQPQELTLMSICDALGLDFNEVMKVYNYGNNKIS